MGRKESVVKILRTWFAGRDDKNIDDGYFQNEKIMSLCEKCSALDISLSLPDSTEAEGTAGTTSYR
jgi:hypothetical protein